MFPPSLLVDFLFHFDSNYIKIKAMIAKTVGKINGHVIIFWRCVVIHFLVFVLLRIVPKIASSAGAT